MKQFSVLQCITVYRSVLQCVAVCCSVVQCGAVRVAMWCSGLIIKTSYKTENFPALYETI